MLIVVSNWYEPLPTGGKSPIVPLNVIGWKGAPNATSLIVAYCKPLGKDIFGCELEKTCIGSGHSGRNSSSEAAQINSLLRDCETP